jgi:hypothetical protein
MHTLAISTANPDAFEYIGIFSHAARIDDSVKERLTALRAANPRLVYMAVGLDDFLLENSRALLQQMKDAGLTPMYEETAGAHTWFVWRRYLSDFAPKLFAGPRTIVTTDPELDDSNSLVRFLLYTNEVTTEGLIYASSQFHWRGDGKGTLFSRPNREYSRGGVNLCPCTSWRWQPGERYIDDAVDIYAQAYPNLKAHDPNYPSPEYLASKIREGNVEFEGDMSKDTPGSDLIKQVLLDDTGGPVHLQAWGGQSTIARALEAIKLQYQNSPEWPAIREKVSKKAIIQARAASSGRSTHSTCPPRGRASTSPLWGRSARSTGSGATASRWRPAMSSITSGRTRPSKSCWPRATACGRRRRRRARGSPRATRPPS